MNKESVRKDKKKVVTFGEVMLRLTAPHVRRFSQANEFIATYGGSEANVAVSLANLGIPTEFVTRLPDNAMARACVDTLRAYGLGTEGIVYGGKRMGIYFLESGAAFRSSNVVYDREDSAFTTLHPGMIDWETIFADAGWFHWSGIAAALSQEGADVCLEALETANRMGLTISCDLNFRKKLWNYGRTAFDIMQPLVQYSDVIFGAASEYEETSLRQNLMLRILPISWTCLHSIASERRSPNSFHAAGKHFLNCAIRLPPTIICWPQSSIRTVH
jgi:2-dehydro-3-deoxygluconokinase